MFTEKYGKSAVSRNERRRQMGVFNMEHVKKYSIEVVDKQMRKIYADLLEENKVIQVLMSTYNGKDYLREQIDSILAQNCKEQMGVSLKLFIRDDGSKDGTQKILDEYAEKYPDRISWYQGENIGVIKSFFELMEKSDEKAEYYAFSDQDDYWHKEKLSEE